MESRKRKTDMEKYIEGITDPPEKRRKVYEFYSQIRNFYKRRWNAPLRLPHIQGVEVDLYKLYSTVMALGGWQKVAAADKWADIAEMLGCKDDVAVSDHAIKLLYMRYLSKFEQVETIGDVDDYVDNEMSRNRGRGATSFFATNDCPISHSRLQEYVPRDERGNIINEPEYCRVHKSLMSGLPNEVDFAVNICMLLSHAGPRQLRVCHAPTLLTLLVAHTGVFDDGDESYASLAEVWKQHSSHDYKSFWASSGIPKDMLEKFLSSEIANMGVDEDDDEFFTGLSDNYNVKDPRSWRLNQVATIIRNLSFEPINRVTIVNSWPVMKFLILCSSTRWAPIFTAAYDALSNLACDINLSDKTLVHVSHHALLRLIQDGILGRDKYKLVRSLEILTGLCSFEGNETTLCDWLKVDTITHIFDIVGVRDIMMCVYTLECLYQISEMGDAACDLIADSPRAIQQLVSMATLEAVSFGPAGLAGMKVVEYQSHLPQQQQQLPPHPHPGQVIQNHPQYAQQRVVQQQQQQQQPATPTPVMTVRQVIQSNLQQQHQNQQQQQQQQRQQTATPTAQNPPQKFGAMIHIQPIVPSTNPGESQVEQLTEKWIKQNCIFESSMSTPRGELYAAYVDDLRNQYHSLSGSLAMFSGVMKNLYPEVNFRMSENGIMIVAQGIRLVRPHRLAPVSSQTASTSSEKLETTHPLMKKMLSEKDPVVNGVNGHSNVKNENEINASDKKTNGTMKAKNGTLNGGKNGSTYDENIPVPRDQKLSNGEAGDHPTEKTNGKLSNGVIKAEKYLKTPSLDGRKKTSMASRAASIVAAAQAAQAMEAEKLEKLEKSEKMEKAECNGEASHVDLKPDVIVDEQTDKATTSAETDNTPIQNQKKKVPTAIGKSDYMCDWDCCSLFYISPAHVLKHLSEEHVVEELRLLCRWNGCTDPTPRNRWSLITHIQDMHCNENQLKLSAQKRRDGVQIARAIPRTEIVPRDISNHPGYAKNAAMEAIRRHAFNFLPRDITDEAEGPVTKSIRLTSCLILRNLARYSAEGRQKLRRHESNLCWLALSRLESSHALSQLLSELHQSPATEEETKAMSTAPSTNSLSSLSNATPNASTPATPVAALNPQTANVTNHVSRNVTSAQRVLNFSAALNSSAELDNMPPPSMTFSSNRHSTIPHIPSSPLVQTTPLRAGASH